jgi:hypothetical protein
MLTASVMTSSNRQCNLLAKYYPADQIKAEQDEAPDFGA